MQRRRVVERSWFDETDRDALDRAITRMVELVSALPFAAKMILTCAVSWLFVWALFD